MEEEPVANCSLSQLQTKNEEGSESATLLSQNIVHVQPVSVDSKNDDNACATNGTGVSLNLPLVTTKEDPEKKVAEFAAAVPVITPLRRSERERKSVQLEGYVTTEDDEELLSAKPAVEIPEVPITVLPGCGMKLGEIPIFVSNIEALRPSSSATRKLFRVLYGVAGKPNVRSQLIQEWSGIPAEDDTEAYDSLLNELQKQCTLTELKEVGSKLFGLSSGIDSKDHKMSWANAITDILANPCLASVKPAVTLMPSNHYNNNMSNNTLSTNITPISSTPHAKRSGAGAFQVFCSTQRPILKEQNPDASHKEIVQMLSAEWKVLTPEQKDLYAQQIAKGKGRTNKRRKKSHDSSSEEDVIEDDDDEEI